MFIVWYIVEEMWGNEKERFDEDYSNLKDAIKDCEKEFNEDDYWWIEDEKGNIVIEKED